MRNLKLFGQLLTMLLGLMFFVGCQQDEVAAPIEERNTLVGSGMTFYGLGPSNELYLYRLDQTPTLLSESKITGLSTDEKMLAIDMQPSTQTIFGVSDKDVIYTIRPSGTQAFATKISSEPLKPGIEGSTIGFDFNPTTDKISLMTDTGQNLRIDPATGQVVGVDMGSKVLVNGSAFSGQTLYNIDIAESKLYKQDLMTGNTTVVGSTGMRISGESGFDISSKGTALAVSFGTVMEGFNSPKVPAGTTRDEAFRLYVVSLTSGLGSELGTVKPMIGLTMP